MSETLSELQEEHRRRLIEEDRARARRIEEAEAHIDDPTHDDMRHLRDEKTEGRRPSLTQSDPEREQKRDDAEFLGREAAHVLPQSERDRQQDAARFQNPEEKLGREQELKPEMSLAGASNEPPASKEKGGQEKAPAQTEQKEEAKAPVSALGQAEARFNSRDEKDRPGEQKADEQKAEQKAEQTTEAKKPASALGRSAAHFDRKDAERPRTIETEERSRRM